MVGHAGRSGRPKYNLWGKNKIEFVLKNYAAAVTVPFRPPPLVK